MDILPILTRKSRMYEKFYNSNMLVIISENRQNTMSELGFGLLRFIQNTTKETGGARGLQ